MHFGEVANRSRCDDVCELSTAQARRTCASGMAVLERKATFDRSHRKALQRILKTANETTICVCIALTSFPRQLRQNKPACVCVIHIELI